MKITVILTGGTIACKTENHIMNPQADSAYSIINMYKSQINSNIALQYFKRKLHCQNLQPTFRLPLQP